jgi:hypothetical protein
MMSTFHLLPMMLIVASTGHVVFSVTIAILNAALHDR